MIRNQKTEWRAQSYLWASTTDVIVWYTNYLNHTAVIFVRPMSKIDLFLVKDTISLAARNGQHLLRSDLKLIGPWYQYKYIVRHVHPDYADCWVIRNRKALIGFCGTSLYAQNIHDILFGFSYVINSSGFSWSLCQFVCASISCKKDVKMPFPRFHDVTLLS